MSEGISLSTPQELYELLTDDRREAIPSHFLDTYFNETHFSADREILIGELPAVDRKMAPFVLPTEQGKPVMGQRGEKVRSLLPPYMKPKDAVRAVDARNVTPAEVFRNAGVRPSLQQRFDQRVAEVQDYHRRQIRMQETRMAADAFVKGAVTIKYDRDQGADFPEVTMTFGRDPGHTAISGAGFYWSDPDFPILDAINDDAHTMNQALRGGFPGRIYLGSEVAKFIGKNKQIQADLDTTRRGTQSNVQTGVIRRDEPMTSLGTIGAGIELMLYRDYVENADGSLYELLDPKSILYVAPGARGVRAYGAIYNAKALAMAGGEALQTDIFPSMWLTDDPSDIFLMHEASPLPIPLTPNKTFLRRVLA